MSSNTTTSAVAKLTAPAPDDIFFYNNNISDNQLKTALWVSVTAGAICLFIFGVARKWIPTYKLRLVMPNVWIRPPPLPEGGIQQLWSWLYPVFATSDAELMRTAGLDCLMLCWTASLGIQIFLPLTILGMAVLLPINLFGGRVTYQGDVSQGSLLFQRLTLSNLQRGASTYWVACVFVYITTGYVCFLLLKYYQAYAILRQRYMTGGEAMINQWHERVCNAPKGGKGKGPQGECRKDGTRMWQAFRELVDVNAQLGHLADSVSGQWSGSDEVSLRHKYETPLSTAIMTRRTSFGQRQQQQEPLHETQSKGAGIARASAPAVMPAAPAGRQAKRGNAAASQGGSMEDVSLKSLAPQGSRGLDNAALRAHLTGSARRAAGTSGAASHIREDEQGIEEEEKQGSGLSSYMDESADEEQGVPARQAMSRGLQTMSEGGGRWNIARRRVMSRSAPAAAATWDASGQALPISRYETTFPNSAAAAQVQPWWAYEADSDGVEGRQLTGKPSVFFRKTVNAHTSCGEDVAVNAQQYAVLVMDVPDLRPAHARRHRHSWLTEGVKQIWGSAKRLLYPRVKHYRKKQKPGAEPDSKGLSSRQVADAETPKSSDHDTILQVKGSKVEMKKIGTGVDAMSPPKVGSDVEQGLGSMASLQAVSEEEWHEEVANLSPQELVEATFQRLFPGTFLYALPIWKHKAVDELLWKWDTAYGRLHAAEAAYEASGCQTRPAHHLKKWGCRGEVDSIDFWAARVRQLETAVECEQKKIMTGPSSSSYFAFFSTQKDAAFAAQTRIHPEDSHSFRVMEAPGPEEVNWQALWKPRWQRTLREAMVLPLIIIVMLVPLGLFTGTLAQATSAICGGSDTGRNSKLAVLRTSWYCEDGSLIRPLITSLLPSLLLTTWQSLIMPIALYCLAQMEGKWVSCSSLDRRIASLFFTWGVFNVFLGAMLGGSIFSKIRLIVSEPSAIPEILGSALTTSSNFFIDYVIIQAFAIAPFRLLFPYFGVITNLLQCCGLCKPRSSRDKVIAHSAMSVGYGREVGVIMLIYIMAFAYAACSPIILPFTLCYFTSVWVLWRYTVLYMTERCYESGGRVWDQVFNNVCWCLFICIFFTGCVFLANSAYIQACIMWVTLIPSLFKFNRYAKARYGEAVSHMPLETAHTAPDARVDPTVYTPPQLRQGAFGWYPEYGKPWENWWLPAYVV
ncbi:hypothetical protein CVIRNUC_006472 [Coccomyxa viridis]|uniref:ERD4-related membrane protein n=1 Tax=Coccomyxa viridis TaxID=1274662 RepID=A0AAV1I7F0_9CHLO|nr:hypothetical protein CVIRNUC_006472 [Coccomyxa viridis]